MRHFIKPVINDCFSCHQALLVTYAVHNNRQYEMIFAESWGFGYQKDDIPFASTLDPNYQDRRNLLYEKFHGISIKEFSYASLDELVELIRHELPYSPIMLHCDIFNCPWNISFKRNHIDHFVMIVGLENRDKSVRVIDPYSTPMENVIMIKDIALDCGTLYTFSFMPQKFIESQEYQAELKSCVTHIEYSNFFHSYHCFAEAFNSRFDEVLESQYLDIYAVPLVINLRRVSNQRYCFNLFLEKMSDMNLIDPVLIADIKIIADKYGLLRALVMREILKKKTTNICKDVLEEIICLEQGAYEKIKSYV